MLKVVSEKEQNIIYLYEPKDKFSVDIQVHDTYMDICFFENKKCYYTYRIREYEIIPGDDESFMVEQSEKTSIPMKLRALATGNFLSLPKIFQYPPYCTKIMNTARQRLSLPPTELNAEVNPVAEVLSLILSHDWFTTPD